MLGHQFISRGSDFEITYASPTILSMKGADEESVTRHERKKQARAYNDEEGKLSEADGRKRRSQGSSDNGSNITCDGFVNEDLRVGGPYLCSLPLEIKYIPRSHLLYQRLCSPGNPLLERVRSILDKYHIDYTEAACIGKQSKFNPETQPVLTVAILARRQERDNTWLKASREIHSYLLEEGLADVSVEIADPEAFEPNQAFPVFTTDAVYPVWDSVRDTILATIDLTDVKAVGCYRFGKSSVRLDNPPTVVIMSDTRSTRDWKETREIVINILNRLNLHMVAVVVVKDEISRQMNTGCTLDQGVLRGPAMLGQSIGLQNDTVSSGTFGGFIQLKNPKDGVWDTFGITCFHCVVPGEKEFAALPEDFADKIRDWCRNGIPMNDPTAKQYLQLTHPSLRDMEEKLEELTSEAQQISQSAGYRQNLQMEEQGLLESLPRITKANFIGMKERLRFLNTFSENIRNFREQGRHELGYVVAGSGFKKRYARSIQNPKYPTCLDWALIRVRDERQGLNLFPDGKELDNPPDEMTDVTGASLFIYGSASGHSAGVYDGLRDAKVATEIVDGKPVTMVTLEHNITGIRGNLFSKSGDSGALVRNLENRMMGMVYAGPKANNWSYFTHVVDLFDDIVESTGAAGIRMLE